MSEPDRPDSPNLPTFQFGPGVQENLSTLTGLGTDLTSGNIPSFLRDLITPNSQLVQDQINLATRSVERTRGQAQQSIINQLEANNQLTSSVAVNRLSELNEEFSRDISDISTRFAIADVERSFTNKFNLFGLGLQAAQSGAQLGIQSQGQQNQFNLANFENQLAINQLESQKSGFGGTLGGVLGTGLGFALGGPVGAGIGGALGGGIGELISPSQTGAGAGAFIGGGLNLASQGFGEGTSGTDLLQLPEFAKIQQGRNQIGFGGVRGLAGSLV